MCVCGGGVGGEYTCTTCKGHVESRGFIRYFPPLCSNQFFFWGGGGQSVGWCYTVNLTCSRITGKWAWDMPVGNYLDCLN